MKMQQKVPLSGRNNQVIYKKLCNAYLKPCAKLDVEQTALLLIRIMMFLSCYQGRNSVGGDYLLLLFFDIDTGGEAE
jgi:hypothetical protein